MSAEHRIDPDFAEPLDRVSMRQLIREELRARDPVELSYSEGPRDLAALCQILKWCAGLASALAVAGICGAVVMYGDIQSMRTEMASLRRDFDDFRKLVEPRYRGGSEDAIAP